MSGSGERILQNALDLVHGDRQADYGAPPVNHGRTALMWNAYLEAKYGNEFQLDAEDVCWLNVLQKLSRRMHSPSEDSLVDVAGYAANVAMLDD